MSKFIPKWANIADQEYILREAAAFISFVKRQQDKTLTNKTLRANKSAPTIIATSGQKNCPYEQFMIDALKDLF